MIGLNPSVNLTFTEDTENLILRAPYNEEFIQAMGWNDIKREFIPQGKYWRIPESEFDDIMKLLGDFYEELG